MHRIDNSTAAASLPAPAAAGTPGYFTAGNPSAGTPATIVDPDWMNDVQEELISILTAADVTPDKTKHDQLLTAIQTLGRIKLTANTTFYVSTTGSDSTGNGASGAPWATIQHALTMLQQNYDLNGQAVTISVADGTYNESPIITGPFTGDNPSAGSLVTLQGDLTTPDNCVIAGNSAVATLTLQRGAAMNVGGFKLTNSGSGGLLSANTCAWLNVSGSVDLGAAGSSAAQVSSLSNATITMSADFKVSGNSGGVLHAEASGNLNCGGRTITLSSAISATTFASAAQLGYLSAPSCIFVNPNNLTGSKYSVTGNAVINTNGAGTSYFPGSAGGSFATGGEYL